MPEKLSIENRPMMGLPGGYKTHPFIRQIMEMSKHMMVDADPAVKEIFDFMCNCDDLREFGSDCPLDYFQTLYDVNYIGDRTHQGELRTGGNPLNSFVFSLFLYHSSNLEMALGNAAFAMFQGEEVPLIYLSLFLLIHWQMNMPESVNQMLDMYLDRMPMDYYYKKSWEHLSQNNMDGFDHYLQRINAVGLHPTIFIDAAKVMTTHMVKQGHWESVKRDWVEETEKTFLQSESAEDVRGNVDRWEEDENKNFIAQYITDLCLKENIGRPKIVEIGCHAGVLLEHIAKKVHKFNLACKFVGIEPNEKAVDIGREKYPYIDFHLGKHDVALAGDFRGDILILSFMCLLNPMETIQEIFNWAGGRFKHIVITDDIVNMYGDFPIFRRHYMVHTYKQMLEQAGFNIVQKLPLPRYTVAANGLICAEYSDK